MTYSSQGYVKREGKNKPRTSGTGSKQEGKGGNAMGCLKNKTLGPRIGTTYRPACPLGAPRGWLPPSPPGCTPGCTPAAACHPRSQAASLPPAVHGEAIFSALRSFRDLDCGLPQRATRFNPSSVWFPHLSLWFTTILCLCGRLPSFLLALAPGQCLAGLGVSPSVLPLPFTSSPSVPWLSLCVCHGSMGGSHGGG